MKQNNKRPKDNASTSGSSKKQKSKSANAEWPSSHLQMYTESPVVKQGPVNSGEEETTTLATGSGLDDLLQLQDLPFAAPTRAIERVNRSASNHVTVESNVQDVAVTLCLSEENNDNINELKKQRNDARDLAGAHALRLSVANDYIFLLKKKLRDAQYLAQTQRFEIADIKDEIDRLRKGNAKVMVQLSNCKEKCTQMQDEIDQMRMKDAME